MAHQTRYSIIHYMFFSALLATSLAATPVETVKRELTQVMAIPNLTADRRAAEMGRLNYWLAKYTDDKAAAKVILETALAELESANAQGSNNPELLVAWIAVAGELAQHKSKLAALGQIKPLEKAAIQLKELDPGYRNFAADRILGRLYHLAPSFLSIGSRSKARQHFEYALAGAPQFPENLIFYAEFLHSIGEKERAIALCKEALQSPLLSEFPVERAFWETLAKNYLENWTGKKT